MFETTSTPSALQAITTKRYFRTIALALAIFVSSFSLGCYGTFPLTNSLYKANGNISENTVINSIVMFILGIFGIYGICIWVDALILNSIEFWSGEEMELSQSYEQPDGSVVTLAPGSSANEAVLTLARDGKVVVERTMIRDESGVTRILDESNNVIGQVVPDGDGGFQLLDENRLPAGHLSAERIETLKTETAG